jgi:hypothetical protein
LTADEELNILEDNVRRLKIEFDTYFGGGSKKPPSDLEWRVSSVIKRLSDGRNLNFAQRFRFNSITQKYAVFNALWQQKLRIKEEGYRRPQDAVLGIQGVRVMEDEKKAVAPEVYDLDEPQPVRAHFTDPDAEKEKVKALYEAMSEAQRQSGKKAGSFESFQQFLKKKTEQIRKEQQCAGVEYSVEMENGQAKLKAKAK